MNNDCYNGLTGEVITPCSEEYNEDRQIWNRAIQKFPIVIVYCYNKTDVSNAICWAREKCIPIRIRNGGHNYEGYSTGNCVLVIDVSKMNNLKLDEEKNELNVQGGAVNSQIYELVGSQGYPFPSGTCPTVGAAGLIQGGGWGLSCRYLGLACDNLLSLELIDYNGDSIIANECENSDLFWACRGGGGGNFGVIVSMTFKLPQKVSRVSLIRLECKNVEKEIMQKFISIWQEWLIDLDNRMTVVARLYNSKEEGLEILGTGLFYGPVEEANEILDVFRCIYNMNIYIEYLSFLEAIEIIESSYPAYEKFKSTGRFVYRNYNCEEICNIIDIVENRPLGSIISGFSLYALGGKVAQISEYDTAYYYRKAKYIILIHSQWGNSKFQKDNINWVNRNFKYIESITKGSYINFPYNKLKCYEIDYYGQNTCKLREINKKYDPLNVFKFPQSIN